MDQPDEDDVIYNTNLPVVAHLTHREWHAFLNGACRSTFGRGGGHDGKREEKHYWRAGFVAGKIIEALVLFYIYGRFPQ